MLQTHFLKKRLPTNAKFASPIQSALYSTLPDDCLIPKNNLLDMVKGRDGCKDFTTLKAILNILEDLVSSKYIEEFHGLKLERLLNVKV